jgi:5-methyltetrahydrofolate--homocysteine methyltransferase
VAGEAEAVRAGVQAALAAQTPAETIMTQALVPAMAEVGRLFECGDYFTPEMMISAEAMQGGLALLRPLLAGTGAEPKATIALGTIKGDLHDIGKNMVGMMMEGAGLRVVDLGVNVTPEKFVEAARQGAHALGISALLTTTMPNMRAVINALVQAGLRQRVKVLVGGAPLTEDFADEIGADGYAPDASSGARRALELLGLRRA